MCLWLGFLFVSSLIFLPEFSLVFPSFLRDPLVGGRLDKWTAELIWDAWILPQPQDWHKCAAESLCVCQGATKGRHHRSPQAQAHSFPKQFPPSANYPWLSSQSRQLALNSSGLRSVSTEQLTSTESLGDFFRVMKRQGRACVYFMFRHAISQLK